jgi:hypothetical protein
MQSDVMPFVLVGKLTTDMAAETFLKWRDKIASTVRSERGSPHCQNSPRWASHLASAKGLAQRPELNPRVDFRGVGSEWRLVRGDAQLIVVTSNIRCDGPEQTST